MKLHSVHSVEKTEAESVKLMVCFYANFRGVTMESEWYREFYKCKVCEFTSDSMPEIRSHVTLEHDKLLSKPSDPPVTTQELNSGGATVIRGELDDDEEEDERESGDESEEEEEEETDPEKSWVLFEITLIAINTLQHNLCCKLILHE